MTLSTAVMAEIQKLIVADIQRKDGSRIGDFLVWKTAGGWEPWFQVEAAHALIKAGLATDFKREQPVAGYPLKDDKGAVSFLVGNTKKCDLVTAGGKGATMFIEIKTQRSGAYAATLADFEKDIKKFNDYGILWRQNYPCFAIAVLTVAGNQAKLDALRAANQGHLEYYVYPKLSSNADPMERITDSIASYKPGAGNILLAKWSNQ